MRIAYFGDENSHTFAAAKSSFNGEDDLFLSCPTVKQCFEALNNEKAEICVVPLENSVEGTVRETLNALNDYTVYIYREINMPIEQSLIAYRGADKSDIKIVYSHYQALAQCKNYLEKELPQAELQTVLSTSDALKKINDKTIAAVARKSGGPYTTMLEKGIQDYKTNETRFAALSKKPQFDGNKCSIIFDTADKPGALRQILEELDKCGVNMTKLESRPKGDKLGRYIFFADFDFSKSYEELLKLLEHISAKTNYIKFLGKYKCVNI